MKSYKSLKTTSAMALVIALAITMPSAATAVESSQQKSAIQISASFKSDLKAYKAQLSKLLSAENEIINGWNSVSGENYTTDEVMYAKLKVLLPKISKFVARIEAIKPKDSKIYKAHAGYVEGWNLQFQGYTMTLSALETQDYAKVASANALLAKGRAKISAFSRTIKNF